MERRVRSLIDRNRKVIMDFSEKSGCTIGTKMFFRHMGILEKALEFSPWIHDYRIHHFYKDNPISFNDLKDDSYYKFKIVRNPFSRVISSYVRVMSDKALQKDLKRFPWSRVSDYSFAQFVNYLSKVDIRKIDTHNGQQKKFFEYELENCFDKIVKLEDMASVINVINLKKGFNFKVDGLSSFHHNDIKKGLDVNVSNYKWPNIVHKIPQYKFFYTEELKEMVGKIFKDDIEAYQYTYEDFLKTN